MNKLKIIIADDNNHIAELERYFIERIGGYEILDIALNSKEEIELIEKYSPDIVITDIERKGEDISGLDVILKCEKENKNVKFIIVTASDLQEIVSKNNYTNVISYLKKPIDWDTLIVEIEKANILHYREEHKEEAYYSKGILNLNNELNKEQISLLEKMDVEIKNKLYTNYEYDAVKCIFFKYCYMDEDIGNAEYLKHILKEKEISEDEYESLFNTFEAIDRKYIYTLGTA